MDFYDDYNDNFCEEPNYDIYLTDTENIVFRAALKTAMDVITIQQGKDMAEIYKNILNGEHVYADGYHVYSLIGGRKDIARNAVTRFAPETGDNLKKLLLARINAVDDFEFSSIL